MNPTRDRQPPGVNEGRIDGNEGLQQVKQWCPGVLDAKREQQVLPMMDWSWDVGWYEWSVE